MPRAPRLTPRRTGRTWLAAALALAGGCQSAQPYVPREPVVVTAPSASAPPIDRIGEPPQAPLPPAWCPPPCPSDYPMGELYAGVALAALPSLGATLEGGQVFTRTSYAVWSFEMRVTLQDLDSDVFGMGGGGTWGQIQGGVKASFFPCRRLHPTLRAGLGWFRTTEENDLVEEPGDYPNLYVGLGLEYDVSRRFTTGPEITLSAAAQEKGFDVILVPQLSWHFLVKF